MPLYIFPFPLYTVGLIDDCVMGASIDQLHFGEELPAHTKGEVLCIY